MGNALHADKNIPLMFSSLTGNKYQSFHCIECGAEILIRNNEHLIRVGNQGMPEVARPSSDGTIPIVCHECSQKYHVLTNGLKVNNELPLYVQPQSIFIAIEIVKQLRDIHCVECGKTFFSFSDRISMISDNTPPPFIQDENKIGAMEAWCKNSHCKQRWSIMV